MLIKEEKIKLSKHDNKVGILIVNGGIDPKYGKWIELCIDKIIEYTSRGNYHIFVWNNNVHDYSICEYLGNIDCVTLIQANPNESLAHPHAVPLQRLYEHCKADDYTYVVTMDSDAHPICDGWLENLIYALDETVVLAGVWRNELKKAIDPYIHASCLCTTVEFVEKHALRFDYSPFGADGKIRDTLSHFTEKALIEGLSVFRLERSNRNSFHRLMGGVYGDLIYHHGAGSRVTISFWDDVKILFISKFLTENYKRIRNRSSHLLFSEYSQYLKWLQGAAVDERFSKVMKKLSRINFIAVE